METAYSGQLYKKSLPVICLGNFQLKCFMIELKLHQDRQVDHNQWVSLGECLGDWHKIIDAYVDYNPPTPNDIINLMHELSH